MTQNKQGKSARTLPKSAVAFRLPAEAVIALDIHCRKMRISRTQYLRDLVMVDLSLSGKQEGRSHA